MGIRDIFKMGNKDTKETGIEDRLVFTIINIATKISSKKELTEYDRKFINMTTDLMRLDMEHKIEKAEKVLNFMKTEKDNCHEYGTDWFVKGLEISLKKMKDKYELVTKDEKEK